MQIHSIREPVFGLAQECRSVEVFFSLLVGCCVGCTGLSVLSLPGSCSVDPLDSGSSCSVTRQGAPCSSFSELVNGKYALLFIDVATIVAY